MAPNENRHLDVHHHCSLFGYYHLDGARPLNPFLTLLLGSLVTYRLSLLFADDDGPWGMFRRLRGWLKREARASPRLRKSEVHRGVECLRCESVWHGALLAAYGVSGWRSVWVDGFLVALALSGAAILLHRAFPPR